MTQTINYHMSIKYEIHSIKNSQGTGEERNFARIFEHEPMTAEQLKSHIQDSCSLTKGDIEATLSALREHMIHELSHGNRFYIPSIGYFSLSVDLDMPEDKPIDKVRGDYISVRNIKFRPDAAMLQEIKSNVRFERADFSSKSSKYTEEEMLSKIKAFLATNVYLGNPNRRKTSSNTAPTAPMPSTPSTSAARSSHSTIFIQIAWVG